MAKFLLKAGAEVDFLTEDEFSRRMTKFEGLFKALIEGQEGHTINSNGHSVKTDATGGTSTLPDGVKEVYRVPVGYDAFMTRFSIDYEGSNAASPVSCDIRVVAGSNTPSALRAIYNVVPAVYESSRSHAALFHQGENIGVSLTGGPASTTLYVSLQIVLVRNHPVDVDVLTTDN